MSLDINHVDGCAHSEAQVNTVRPPNTRRTAIGLRMRDTNLN